MAIGAEQPHILVKDSATSVRLQFPSLDVFRLKRGIESKASGPARHQAMPWLHVKNLAGHSGSNYATAATGDLLNQI